LIREEQDDSEKGLSPFIVRDFHRMANYLTALIILVCVTLFVASLIISFILTAGLTKETLLTGLAFPAVLAVVAFVGSMTVTPRSLIAFSICSGSTLGLLARFLVK
jgi:hypothetical protein